MNRQLTCSRHQWLHSSVGRASHRYREVTGSNPVEVLNFFQASLRNCINCVHCDDHFLHFHFISAVHIQFISYITNTKIIVFLFRCGALTGTVYTWKRLVVLSVNFIKCKKLNYPFSAYINKIIFTSILRHKKRSKSHYTSQQSGERI